MVLPHFDVLCDLLLNRPTATWNLFYIKKKLLHTKLFYFKIFQHNSKPSLFPLWQTLRKPFDVIYCLYRMKQSHWLLCEAKNCDWSRKIAPLSNLTRANENLQRKQNWTAKCQKRQVLVIRAARWAEKLGCCPEYCRSWILAVAVNIGGYPIRVLHERSIAIF